MSLEGNLSAFGLSEILQLIALQQKSGMLSISRQGSSMMLFFRDGKIISTRDRRRGVRDPIKDYLARYGILSRRELMRLTDISAESKIDVTDVIVSEGLLSEDDMKAHYRNHIQETVHDILTWEQCSYKFIPGKDVIDGIKIWGEFGIEGTLMESMRRIDEFPQMLDEFPDGALSINRTRKSDKKDGLSPNESAIMEMLSDERTVEDLVAHAKMPKFDTYEALKHLKEKGLVHVVEKQTAETGSEVGARIKRRRRRLFQRNPLPLVVSLAMVTASGFWGARSIAPLFKDTGHRLPEVGVATNALSLERSQAEEQLRWYLEIYRAKHGHYPSRLSNLSKTGIAPDSFVERVEHHAFRYYLTPQGDRYTLL
ncbi:MAG: DUF4388 domain-containing protein [Candidatus Latescibacterota bacterium]|nr:MAG: DUF4388 domain-containing protein [Candidatus Latescibacterota bacterium]